MAKNRIVGIEKINKSLKEFIKETNKDVTIAMLKAAIMIEGKSNQLAPVDTNFLRSSSYTQILKQNSVQVGYTAKYAPYVHEAPMTLKGQPREDFGKTKDGVSFGGGSGKGNYWDTGTNKFLKKAFNRNHEEFTRIVVNGIEV